MLPLNLKIDKNGLLYLEDIEDLYRRVISLDQRPDKREYYASCFFRIDNNDDYIIKKPITLFTREERKIYLEFLGRLVDKQKEVPEVDFPIGYYRERKKIEGLIVRYYQDGISLDNINREEDINLIGKYYYHDEDNIHNLFLMFNEILSLLEVMYEHGINYTDVCDNNFVIWNNQVKVIDFDPYSVTFIDKYNKLNKILERYIKLINYTLNCYHLRGDSDNIQNFKEAKKLTLKIENGVRKNR